ncbi:ribonuclease P protein component [Candidatus Borreliella tachyglossi]|uniref:Ribonuclease P protein component n=1 Tax=Candidatus Borreliella tachyglossi TaxID=1964448 RepID=A0A2S1LWY5_9SPIR|nr:ribonuclease P protein component [Candidatus Borreliella tachyglossi]AWG42813.1 ribonuclease P protein component [Candidatus Borreliella tachyglossi]
MKRRSISIKSKLEIQELFKKGKLIRMDGCNVFYEFTSLAVSRILVTFPRIFKGAVKRNRVRRIFKECFRRQFDLFKDSSLDFAFVVSPKKSNINYCEVETLINNLALDIMKRKV